MCNLASIRVTMSYRAKQDLIETSLFPPRQVFLSLISITNARSTCVKHPQLDATGRCLLADVCQSRSRFCRKSQTEASASEQTKVKKHFQIHTNEQTRGILLIVVVDQWSERVVFHCCQTRWQIPGSDLWSCNEKILSPSLQDRTRDAW